MKNRSLPATGSARISCAPSLPHPSLTNPPLNTAPDQAPSPQRALSRIQDWRVLCGLLLGFATLSLTSCKPASYYYYKFPEYNYAGRPVPPSQLAQRVMIAVTYNGGLGGLQVVDALRDIRSNIQNTIPQFGISGYSSGLPQNIYNFPSELRGYVYSGSDGSVKLIDYSSETSPSSVGTFQPGSNSLAIPPSFAHFYGAEQVAGVLEVIDNQNGGAYPLNIPNVFKVVANKGDTIALAMVRNSNVLYRVFKLNQNQYPTQQAAIAATGSVDCEPSLLPVYCAVSVPGTYDHPSNVYFSLDGTTAYVMNCGPECGGNTASVTVLQQSPLNEQLIPSVLSPQPSPMIANVPVPGGVTEAISDGSTLYLAGQQLQTTGPSAGLFAGFLSTMNQATNTVTHQYSISDGNHTKMLFADNNTLWIGSQFCASGPRQYLFAHGTTAQVASQAANYNCLTMVKLVPGTPGYSATLTAQVVPAVNQAGVNSSGSPVAAVPVAFPNQNNDQFYYGSLTGLCWVENYNKIYTAYGGQVHIFSTATGLEIDNQYVAVQGTALDVAYMDASTDDAD